MSDADEILMFWFGPHPRYAERRKLWFGKDSALDAELRRRFEAVWRRAGAGELASWESGPEQALALTILLDQFPRNMFRDTPEAFATDRQAREVATRAIERGFDRAVPSVKRFFFYLPFEHSEDLADQERSVRLSSQFRDDADLADVYDYAVRHRDVIARFGRFPHRNAIIGRESTSAEIEFLREPGSRF
ncbi:MAG TPA: DUF924 family protein [Pelomicrobium sp.]|nr:DUF924 family protein [Pelomicrobium sp.]